MLSCDVMGQRSPPHKPETTALAELHYSYNTRLPKRRSIIFHVNFMAAYVAACFFNIRRWSTNKAFRHVETLFVQGNQVRAE